jgi:hypothetical protein
MLLSRLRGRGQIVPRRFAFQSGGRRIDFLRSDRDGASVIPESAVWGRMGQKLIDFHVDVLHKGRDHHPQMRHHQGRSRKVCLEATDLCTGTRESIIRERTRRLY